MSKNAIIFHGTGGHPDNFWYKWLGEQLERKGYAVSIPHYPDINTASAKVFVPKVINNYTFTAETVLVGHSAGGPLILSILERIEPVIAQAVLVAGFCELMEKFDDPITQEQYDWHRIREHAKDFVFINSDNDPWGCDDKQGRRMFDNLGGTLIIRHDGHFGSTDANQPYPTFDLLNRLIG